MIQRFRLMMMIRSKNVSNRYKFFFYIFPIRYWCLVLWSWSNFYRLRLRVMRLDPSLAPGHISAHLPYMSWIRILICISSFCYGSDYIIQNRIHGFGSASLPQSYANVIFKFSAIGWKLWRHRECWTWSVGWRWWCWRPWFKRRWCLCLWKLSVWCAWHCKQVLQQWELSQKEKIRNIHAKFNKPLRIILKILNYFMLKPEDNLNKDPHPWGYILREKIKRKQWFYSFL